jgi:hypothetical protein
MTNTAGAEACRYNGLGEDRSDEAIPLKFGRDCRSRQGSFTNGRQFPLIHAACRAQGCDEPRAERRCFLPCRLCFC